MVVLCEMFFTFLNTMLWILAIYLYRCTGLTMTEPLCRPTISGGLEGKPEIDGFISLECEISTCDNLTKLVFEKSNHNMTWAPIFQTTNKTYFKALDTDSEYTLEGRNVYYAFRTKHTLYIKPLILQDDGRWRCVVHDAKQIEYKSEPLEFIIYVPPHGGQPLIGSNSSHLVVHQTKQYTCFINGVHPEPDLLWEVNGVEKIGNVTSNQRDDPLWNVTSAIKIKFDTVGVHRLSCVIKTDLRDPWLEDYIDITVKEAAVVLYPLHDLTTTVNVDSTFSLWCRGTGYAPFISWNRNGELISFNDANYIIERECNNSKCNSSISSKPMDSDVACGNGHHYSGVYTCVISQEPPYQSSVISSNMSVTFSDKICKDENFGHKVGWSMFAFVCVVLIASALGARKYLKYRNKQHEDKEDVLSNLLNLHPDISFYQSFKIQHTIKPEHATEIPLKLCGQSRSYDQVVLFEFGTKRVFIYELDNFERYRECTSDVTIDDMIRTSQDMFVVTEHGSNDIYLLHLTDGKFHTKNTMPGGTNSRKTLICNGSDKSKSFIKCEISEDIFSPYDISISHVCIAHDKLKPHHISTVTVDKAMPYYLSLTSDNTCLSIRTGDGLLYTVDLHTKRFTTDENCMGNINECVWSMFIDKHDNTIICDSRQIHIFTADKQHSVLQEIDEPAHGITVNNKQMVVVCGHQGGLHHIKVYSTEQKLISDNSERILMLRCLHRQI